MAGPDTISETDDDNGAQGGGPVVDLPSPLRPAATPPIRTGANAPPPADEQFEIIEVDNLGQEIGAPQPIEPPAAAAAAGRRPAAGDLPADSELEYAPRPEFGEDGQPTRAMSKRERRKQGRERTFQENAQLRQQVEFQQRQLEDLQNQFQAVAPRVVELGESEIRNRAAGMGNEIVGIDRQIEDVESRYFDAIQAGDRAVATRLGREKEALGLRKYQLTAAKQQVDEALANRARDPNYGADQRYVAPQPRVQAPPQRAQQAPPLPARAEALRADFIENDAPWIGQPGNEQDARVLATIDDGVAAEGYDPASQDYWDELHDRGAKYLPHRFKDATLAAAAPAPGRRAAAQQPAPIRRGPPTAAPAGPSAQPSRNQVRIDPGRKEGLIQAGVLALDGTVLDKKRFNNIVKGFADYDRANGAGRS